MSQRKVSIPRSILLEVHGDFQSDALVIEDGDDEEQEEGEVEEEEEAYEDEEEVSFSLNEGGQVDNSQQDDKTSSARKGSAVKSASKKKRRRIIGETVRRASDKWISCPRSGHYVYVMPGSPADGNIPAYDDLEVGPTRLFCNEHGKPCHTCKQIVSTETSLVCEYSKCQRFYCKPHATGKVKNYTGFWFCTEDCREAVEEYEFQDFVQPFCSQNFKPGVDGLPREQHWINCYTCMMTVCTVCASICHFGHAFKPESASAEDLILVEDNYGTAVCRCGTLKCCRRMEDESAHLKGQELAVATKERLSLLEEETTISQSILQCEQADQHAQQAKAGLVARMQGLDGELARLTKNRITQLQLVHKHTGELLKNTEGITDDALKELHKGLDAVVLTMQHLVSARDSLPRALEQAERELLRCQKRREEFITRKAKLPALIKLAEARIKKALE